MRQRHRRRIELDVGDAGEKILRRQSGAAIGNHLPFGADELFHQNAGDMAWAADAGGAHRRLLAVRLQPGHQFFQISRRHGLAGVDQERLGCDEANRLEILQKVEVEIVDGAVRHVGSPHAPEHRIAVGRRAFGAGDADDAGRARGVFDNDRLPERLAHALRHDASERIGRSAGRERHNHDDRMVGVVRGPGGSRGAEEEHKSRDDRGSRRACGFSDHGRLPNRLG